MNEVTLIGKITEKGEYFEQDKSLCITVETNEFVLIGTNAIKETQAHNICFYDHYAKIIKESININDVVYIKAKHHPNPATSVIRDKGQKTSLTGYQIQLIELNKNNTIKESEPVKKVMEPENSSLNIDDFIDNLPF